MSPKSIGPRTRRQIAAQVATIREALTAGLTLTIMGPHGLRAFYAGQITEDIAADTGSVRTTHLREDLHGHVWMSRVGIARLAAQATDLLARKNEALAAQASAVRRALDLD